MENIGFLFDGLFFFSKGTLQGLTSSLFSHLSLLMFTMCACH